MGNLSVKQLIIYAAVLVCLINCILIYIFLLTPYLSNHGLSIVLLVVFAFVINIVALRLLFNKFIFNKLNIVYKIIENNNPAILKGDQHEIAKRSMTMVNKDVVEWAQKASEEIKNLKSLENYRKNYVGNVSHELKTPIFSLLGYLTTLAEGGLYDDNINKQYLEKAILNTERLKNIVDDLEIITNLEAKADKIILSNFDVRVLVLEVLSDLKRMAKDKKIKLSTKDSLINYGVYADREMIRQVLNNLIVNSIKYGKKGGKTIVSFYNVKNRLLVEATDNGIGIEQKHHKHLFDRFYSVDKSRSRKVGGSGLGLSIVKHIVEAHGGALTVKSAINTGSKFGFTLSKTQKT